MNVPTKIDGINTHTLSNNRNVNLHRHRMYRWVVKEYMYIFRIFVFYFLLLNIWWDDCLLRIFWADILDYTFLHDDFDSQHLILATLCRDWGSQIDRHSPLRRSAPELFIRLWRNQSHSFFRPHSDTYHQQHNLFFAVVSFGWSAYYFLNSRIQEQIGTHTHTSCFIQNIIATNGKLCKYLCTSNKCKNLCFAVESYKVK